MSGCPVSYLTVLAMLQQLWYGIYTGNDFNVHHFNFTGPSIKIPLNADSVQNSSFFNYFSFELVIKVYSYGDLYWKGIPRLFYFRQYCITWFCISWGATPTTWCAFGVKQEMAIAFILQQLPQCYQIGAETKCHYTDNAFSSATILGISLIFLWICSVYNTRSLV